MGEERDNEKEMDEAIASVERHRDHITDLYQEFLATLEAIIVCPYCGQGYDKATVEYDKCCGKNHPTEAWLQYPNTKEQQVILYDSDLQSAFNEWLSKGVE